MTFLISDRNYPEFSEEVEQDEDDLRDYEDFYYEYYNLADNEDDSVFDQEFHQQSDLEQEYFMEDLELGKTKNSHQSQQQPSTSTTTETTSPIIQTSMGVRMENNSGSSNTGRFILYQKFSTVSVTTTPTPTSFHKTSSLLTSSTANPATASQECFALLDTSNRLAFWLRSKCSKLK